MIDIHPELHKQIELLFRPYLMHKTTFGCWVPDHIAAIHKQHYPTGVGMGVHPDMGWFVISYEGQALYVENEEALQDLVSRIPQERLDRLSEIRQHLAKAIAQDMISRTKPKDDEL